MGERSLQGLRVLKSETVHFFKSGFGLSLGGTCDPECNNVAHPVEYVDAPCWTSQPMLSGLNDRRRIDERSHIGVPPQREG